MPLNCDAKFCDAAHAYKNCNSQGCREFKMLYEGRLQRYCLLLSKEKEVIQKLGFVKNTGRSRSRTFDEGDLKDVKARQIYQREQKSALEDQVRRNSVCQPILRSPKNHGFLTPPNSVKSQRRFSETGRLSPNCEAKFQEYKRHSLPSRIETPKTPKKDDKIKRRQEEMQKKAQLRVQALKSLETDCIKAKQLMSRFKSLSTTNLEIAGKNETENFDNREESNGKRRIQSWHI